MTGSNFFSDLGAQATQGMRRFMMQQAGLNPAQIDTVETLQQQYPALGDLNLRSVISNENNAELKNDILRMLENPELAAQFGQQIQGDPDLVARINYLIENDPERLRTLLPEFEQNPGRLATILQGSVTTEQAAEARRSAEAAAANPLAAFGDFDIREMFRGFAENFSWENLGQMLLAVIQGVNNLVGGMVDGLTRFAQSGELAAAGNGLTSPNGPLQQIASALGMGDSTTLHTENGTEVRTAPIAEHTRPAPSSGPAGAPAPGTQGTAQPGTEETRPPATQAEARIP